MATPSHRSCKGRDDPDDDRQRGHRTHDSEREPQVLGADVLSIPIHNRVSSVPRPSRTTAESIVSG
jgi:hypothetical protein